MRVAGPSSFGAASGRRWGCRADHRAKRQVGPPPVWLDEEGRPLPIRFCHRYGADVPLTQRLAPRSVERRPLRERAHRELVRPRRGAAAEPWGLLPVMEP
jgi:hypothetical protein